LATAVALSTLAGSTACRGDEVRAITIVSKVILFMWGALLKVNKMGGFLFYG